MPVISKFYGIVIRMVYSQLLGARFHAFYDNCELVVGINQLAIIQGEAPRRVSEMVLEWARTHQNELLSDWNLCRVGQRPYAIAPLW